MLTYKQIQELMGQVVEMKLGRLEIEQAGFRLRIDGPAAAVARAGPSAPVAHHPLAQPVGSDHGGRGSSSAETPAAGHHLIKSPIVGTFYGAPSPEAEPFVRVGDRVAKGQVICIVEAMKLMNEIEADADGVIVEILGRNGEPVEFGEPLFGLRKS